MRFKVIIVGVFVFFLCLNVTAAEEWLQVPGVMHVHTTFDNAGHYSLDQLVLMAKAKGLEVLIPSDHDLQVMEYGLPPFRNLVKRREQRDSVIKVGPEKFLAQIAQMNEIQKDVLIIPGVQSSPFYYWTGSPFKGNLTANDYRKELLLIGMQTPEDYRGLPLLDNGFSTRYFKKLLPQSLIFLAGFVFAIYLVLQKGLIRIVGGIISILSIGLLISQHPFQSSFFDPYHGDQRVKPFQEVINYVNARGGQVFWLHPESNYAVNGVQLGPVTLITKHYPDDLITSQDYTGFEAIYGDWITATDPGKHWDRVLVDYCRGIRNRPAWGISGADFHGEEAGVKLETFQTIFLVKHKTTEAILEALAKGRFYAVLKGNSRLFLDQFQVIDNQSGNSSIVGQELDLRGASLVEGKLSAMGNGQHSVKISLIRGGEVVKIFKGETPLEFHYLDQDYRPGKTYYRLDVRSKGAGRLLSNPIFVSFH